MVTNVGRTDRIARLVVAVLAVIGALFTSGAVAVVLWIVAAILAITAIVGYCPLYSVLRMNTNRTGA